MRHGATFVKGVDLTENGQAMDAILANGARAALPRLPHTLANFETAFYRSDIADNNSYEQWLEAGSLDAATARQRDLEADARRVRGAAHRSRASTRRSASS